MKEAWSKKWAIVLLGVAVLVFATSRAETRAEEAGTSASGEPSAEGSAEHPGVRAALVVFSEHSTSGDYTGDSDVGAQLLSFAGELLWKKGESSVPVSDAKVLEGNAVAVPDGVGGYIVAYEVVFAKPEQANDVDIYAQHLSATGELLWGEGKQGVAVAQSVWGERNPVIITDGAGGAIVVFEEYAPAEGEHAGDVDIGAQRLSPQGTLLWNQGEKSAAVASSEMLERAPTAVADGQGGAVVFFEAEITSGEHKGDVDIMAQRLDASGAVLWNEGQVSSRVAASEWRERRPVAVPDGAGGAIVVFEEYGVAGDQYEGDIDVGAQRISAEGKLLWGENRSLAVSEAAEFLERQPTVLADGLGGAWVVFEYEAREGEHAGDSEILAQRVSPTGELAWSEGPKGVAISTWSERAPVVVSDGTGGVIVSFGQHAPQEGEYAGDIDIGAQRLSPDGAMLWNEGDKSATVSGGQWLERQPAAVPDGAGGVVVIFEVEAREGEHTGDSDVGAQRLDASGAMLWNEGQRSTMVAGSEWKETQPRIVANQ